MMVGIMRSSNKRRCLLTRCSATTIAILAKSAQSTASRTTIVGVVLFLPSALLYWGRGEASRKAYQMKLETEASIDTSILLKCSSLYRPRLLDAKNVTPSSHGRSGIFREQCAPALQWNGPDSTCTSKICYPK